MTNKFIYQATALIHIRKLQALQLVSKKKGVMADDWRGKSTMEECIGIHREIGSGIEVESALDLCNRPLASSIPQGTTTQRGGGLPGSEYLGGDGAHSGRIALVSSEFKWW